MFLQSKILWWKMHGYSRIRENVHCPPSQVKVLDHVKIKSGSGDLISCIWTGCGADDKYGCNRGQARYCVIFKVIIESSSLSQIIRPDAMRTLYGPKVYGQWHTGYILDIKAMWGRWWPDARYFQWHSGYNPNVVCKRDVGQMFRVNYIPIQMSNVSELNV